MKTILSASLKLKAEAYQYQVKRFGNYKPPKPLQRAVAKEAGARALTARKGEI